MDFESDLFDISFDELAMFDGQQQGQSQGAAKASALEFQDFCNEFSGNGAEDLGSVPEWNVTDVSIKQDSFSSSDAFDFGFNVDKGKYNVKDSFEGLAPLDSDTQALFGFSLGNDAQVVPDMAAGAAAQIPDFMLPTVSQPAMSAAQPQGNSDPYSWVQGIGCMPIGYTARPRPSDPQARQESLNRYRDKKARRFNNSTKVRYEMRKVNADKRPRIKGRFVKPEELQRHLQNVVTSSAVA